MRTDGFASDRPGLRSAGAAGMGGLGERRGAGEQRPGEEEVGEFHEGDTSHVPYHPAPSEETGQVFFKKNARVWNGYRDRSKDRPGNRWSRRFFLTPGTLACGKSLGPRFRKFFPGLKPHEHPLLEHKERPRDTRPVPDELGWRLALGVLRSGGTALPRLWVSASGAKFGCPVSRTPCQLRHSNADTPEKEPPPADERRRFELY